MKIAYICSRYADPDINNRRRNLAEARALARWAEAHGYAVVTWWGSIDHTDPPCDSDETVRRAALGRSGTLARMVGSAGGSVIMAGWYRQTEGMREDVAAYDDGRRGVRAADVRLVSWSEVEPCYTAPVETVPRAEVQAAVDGIESRRCAIPGQSYDPHRQGVESGLAQGLRELCDHTGVTPTEVTQ